MEGVKVVVRQQDTGQETDEKGSAQVKAHQQDASGQNTEEGNAGQQNVKEVGQQNVVEEDCPQEPPPFFNRP
eukprot:15198106-Ditylum_brightwellii.AAC.1